MANNFSNISSASGCCKHPDRHQLPGVCSSCLRERLHRLVVSPEHAYPSQGLSLIKSPSYSGSSYNKYDYDSLPGGTRPRRHRRSGSAASEAGPVMLAVRVGGSLRKSPSITFVEDEEGEREEEEAGMKTGIKRGFWSKLIRFRSGRSKEKRSWSHHHHHHSASLRETTLMY